MQSLIKARKLESYLEHHRKFHFGIYAMSRIPLLVETIESMWLRCGPVLSLVIPEYVVLLKGWDHHTAALKAIMRVTPMAPSARSSPTLVKQRNILPVLQTKRSN
jgi:DNA-binding GntR family transcriptional regulator